MVEILEFIFSDITHFIGFLILWIIAWWGIAEFDLIRITMDKHYMTPSFFDETDEEDDE